MLATLVRMQKLALSHKTELTALANYMVEQDIKGVDPFVRSVQKGRR